MSYFFSIVLPYLKDEVKVRHFRLISKEWYRIFDDFMLEYYSRPASIFREILFEHHDRLYFSECYSCMYSLCIQRKEWFILLLLHLICKTFVFSSEAALKISRLCNDICLYLNDRVKKKRDFVFTFVYERVLACNENKKRKRSQNVISTGFSRLSSKRMMVV